MINNVGFRLKFPREKTTTGMLMMMAMVMMIMIMMLRMMTMMTGIMMVVENQQENY